MGGDDAVRPMWLAVAFLAARPFSSCFFPPLILTNPYTGPIH
jgi:hypothetical protein